MTTARHYLVNDPCVTVQREVRQWLVLNLSVQIIVSVSRLIDLRNLKTVCTNCLQPDVPAAGTKQLCGGTFWLQPRQDGHLANDSGT